MPAPLLSLTAVARTYPGTPPVPALRDATLDVADGELIAVVGRSGSGKSTLLNVLALLDRPTGGRYTVAAQPVGGLGERQLTVMRSRTFGFVFQQSFLLPTRTAQENVELALVPIVGSTRERRLRARDALARMGLDHRRRFYPAHLSGGECQRVAIARAVACRTRALICDEPTGNLDEQTSADVVGALTEINRAGVTVIIATHDLLIARSLPRALSVRDGIVSEGLADFRASQAQAPLPRDQGR